MKIVRAKMLQKTEKIQYDVKCFTRKARKEQERGGQKHSRNANLVTDRSRKCRKVREVHCVLSYRCKAPRTIATQPEGSTLVATNDVACACMYWSDLLEHVFSKEQVGYRTIDTPWYCTVMTMVRLWSRKHRLWNSIKRNKTTEYYISHLENIRYHAARERTNEGTNEGTRTRHLTAVTHRRLHRLDK